MPSAVLASPSGARSLAELNEDIVAAANKHRDDSIIDCLGHAISHLETYNKLASSKGGIDYEQAYVNFMVSTYILSDIVPKKPDYPQFIANRSKKEIYDGVTKKIFQDKKIDLIKERIKHRSRPKAKSPSPITQPQIKQTQIPRVESELPKHNVVVNGGGKAVKEDEDPDELERYFERLWTPAKDINGGKHISSIANGNRMAPAPLKNGEARTSKADTVSNSNGLLPPLNLHYRSRSPSPARMADIEVDTNVDPKFFGKFNSRWFLSGDELHKLIHNAPKSVLLLDIRNRKEFDRAHILFENILCIEPFSIQSNFTESELQDSLLISPQFEQHLFEHRDIFELVVLYDYDYLIPEDSVSGFHSLPKYFKKLLSTINSRSLEKPLKRNPLVLNGGFNNWQRKFGSQYVTKPRVENLVEPESLPSRPLAFRKTPISSITPGYDNNLVSQDSGSSFDGHFSNSPQTTGNTIKVESVPYAKNLQNFLSYSSPSLNSSASLSYNNTTDGGINSNGNGDTSNYNPVSSQLYFPQQQPPAYNGNRLSFNGRSSIADSTAAPSPQLEKRNSFASSFSNFLKSPSASISSPSLPSKIPLTYNNNNGIKPPERAAFSPNTSSLQQSYFQNKSSSSLTNDASTANGSGNNINNSSSASFNNKSKDSIIKPITTSLDFTSGLYNLGNSCYINCVLQCLVGTTQLTVIFLNNSFKRYINVNSKLGSKGVLANNYYEVVKLMSKTDGSYIIPSKFKNICGSLNSEFKGSQQQDCQEFMNFLLDGLHEDLNQCGGHPPMKSLTEEDEARREKLPFRIASTIEWERYLKTDFSAIVDLFQGQYLSRLQCLSCGHTSTTYQAFSTLSLPIPDGKNKNGVTIDECFEEFTKVELLDGDNKWHCPKCRAPKRSTKVLKITRLPKVLILHFKRFKAGFGWEKLETFIKYPVSEELALEKYWTPISGEEERRRLSQLQIRGQVPPFNYKVYGVINHFGNIRGGHYTAYVYKGAKKGWCYYDDTKVYKNQKPSVVCTKDNYVLFMQRV